MTSFPAAWVERGERGPAASGQEEVPSWPFRKGERAQKGSTHPLLAKSLGARSLISVKTLMLLGKTPRFV